ncbi:unnamed protein product [Bemisia tabaci]|uniref:dolichyl-phosphate beta-glucosyltransferase n=1 Tax=Bemisia tabaci TaxID=7038 RepID=A0A9P0CAL8_BEMTA|nr:unnamed protein product [Bemisia tabaci]
MLDECLEFLEEREKKTQGFTYELIIVSDGSNDKTVEVASDYSSKYGSEKIKVLELIKNRGKGGAVRLGMLSARGAILLFADADGATKFAELEKLEQYLSLLCKADIIKDQATIAKKHAIVCGSRAHLEEEAVASRTFFRTLLMHGFHLAVWLLATQKIRDTQCGFKLLTRETAKICFSNLHVERWAFDVELLYIADCFNIPVGEVAVTWTEIPGSKIVPVLSWIQMGRDLVLIWLRYKVGAWKLTKNPDYSKLYGEQATS